MKKHTKRTLEKTARMLISAVAFVPVIGDMIGNARDFYDDLKELALDQDEYNRILDGIYRIKAPGSLNKDDAFRMESAIISLLENENMEIENGYLTDVAIENLKTNLQKMAFEDRLVDDSIKDYISNVVEFIGLPVVRKYLMNSEDLGIVLQDKVFEHDGRIANLEKSTSTNPNFRIQTDNKDYIRHFQQRLFLEEKGSSISLETMYVSPRVKGTDLSVSDTIMRWYRDDSSYCMILYGEAGIGKTSLVSKIIADANGLVDQDKREYSFTTDEVAAVALRNRKDVFESLERHYDSITVLTALFFSGSSYKLKRYFLENKLLILDGFDELMVLVPEFQKEAEIFISQLVRVNYGLKILITTRRGYNDYLDGLKENGIYHLTTMTLCWEESEMNTWCEQYGKQVGELHDDLIWEISELELNKLKERNFKKREWCRNFPTKYHNLPPYTPDDKRRKVLCIPIILYIACNSDVDIEREQTIGQIYDYSFRSIILREHSDTLLGNEDVKDADKRLQKLHWQYTKELAYQMFFIGELELIDDDESDEPRAISFRNAQNRTLKLLQEEYPALKREDLNTTKFLAVFHFAKQGNRDGIAFVHKTVYEYFTAVKLYEDYFSKFNSEYFDPFNENDAPVEVAKCFIAAFRYAAIIPEILQYLKEMERPPFTGDKEDDPSASKLKKKKFFNKKKFFEAFQCGIKQKLLAKIPIEEAVKEYLGEDNKVASINSQLCMAFHNLTWCLSNMGYLNNEIRVGNETTNVFSPIEWIIKFISPTEPYLYCPNWNFEGLTLQETDLRMANLKGANLKGANLQGANLQGAKLHGANLKGTKLHGANLQGANLQGAKLQGANLKGVNLKGAKLQGANLKGANLQGAKLQGANLEGTKLHEVELKGAILEWANLHDAELKGAKYCREPDVFTVFPVGFNPQEHGMIEVDINGKPVK